MMWLELRFQQIPISSHVKAVEVGHLFNKQQNNIHLNCRLVHYFIMEPRVVKNDISKNGRIGDFRNL